MLRGTLLCEHVFFHPYTGNLQTKRHCDASFQRNSLTKFDVFSAFFIPRLHGDVFLLASFWVPFCIHISKFFRPHFSHPYTGKLRARRHSDASFWWEMVSVFHLFFRFFYPTAPRGCVFAHHHFDGLNVSHILKRHTGTHTFYTSFFVHFIRLFILFSVQISHWYVGSSFPRLQREVSLHFHFCQFFIISALVLEPLFRHLYTGKLKL